MKHFISIVLLLLFPSADIIAQKNTQIPEQLLYEDSIYVQNGGKDPKGLLALIQICKKNNDLENECKAWQFLGRDSKLPSQSNRFRLNCYEHALSLARQNNDHQSELDIIRNIADIHIQQFNYAVAEDELLGIIKPEQKASHKNLIFTYDLLAGLYISKAEYGKALFYALKTERSMQTAEDSVYAPTFYYRISRIYRDLDNPSSSLEWSKKAYDSALRKKVSSSILPFIRGAIVNRLIELNRPYEALKFVINDSKKNDLQKSDNKREFFTQTAACYNALKKYRLAEKNYLMAVQVITDDMGEIPASRRAPSYSQFGEFYLKTGRQKEARFYLEKALKNYSAAGDVKGIKDVCLLLFKADSGSRNFASAIRWLQRSHLIKDSIFNSTKNRQIEELQIAYDTEQKNKNIQQLQNTAKVQKLQLIHADSTRNWIIAGSCLIVVIACLLLRQAILAKKTTAAISRKNEALQQLVHEKEWLLKEVHHRVKNNLHTVMCLLESQAKYLENDALHAIESSQQRIFAMSLIHQRLYRSDNIKTINMSEYIPELIQNLKQSFGIDGDISIPLKIDPVTLDIAYAIPLGLIINEAVTNSIKYAFPQQKRGVIAVSLVKKDNKVQLEMTDNGVGIPKGFYDKDSRTLGIELMKGLSEDINGSILFEVTDGTRIVIEFEPAII